MQLKTLYNKYLLLNIKNLNVFENTDIAVNKSGILKLEKIIARQRDLLHGLDLTRDA